MKSEQEIFTAALDVARREGNTQHATIFERALRGEANEEEVSRALQEQAQADAKERAARMISARKPNIDEGD
jgi:hypothetical protein